MSRGHCWVLEVVGEPISFEISLTFVFFLFSPHSFVLLSGLHIPVQNGASSPSGHPYQKGSYSPLPHIYLGNGLGPSWPSDIPHYNLLPAGCSVKRPGRDPQFQGELNGNAALIGRNLKANSTEKDCRKWVEKTNQAMQGKKSLSAFSVFRVKPCAVC